MAVEMARTILLGNNSSLSYIMAVKNSQITDAIEVFFYDWFFYLINFGLNFKIVSDIINSSTTKDEIIVCLKNRIKAPIKINAFESKNNTFKHLNINKIICTVIIKDCDQLRNIGYSLDEDKSLLMILL